MSRAKSSTSEAITASLYLENILQKIPAEAISLACYGKKGPPIRLEGRKIITHNGAIPPKILLVEGLNINILPEEGFEYIVENPTIARKSTIDLYEAYKELYNNHLAATLKEIEGEAEIKLPKKKKASHKVKRDPEEIKKKLAEEIQKIKEEKKRAEAQKKIRRRSQIS